LENYITEPLQYLYHYTDANALHAILTRSEVWATQLGQMNDNSEGRHVREIAKDILLELSTESGNQADREALNEIAELVGESRFVQRVYVFSLSENGDSLSQWRAYSPNGGFSLGINFERLKNVCLDSGWSLNQCVYDDQEKLRMIKTQINQVIQEHNHLPGTIYENVASEIEDKIRDFETYFKHSSFSEEKEWRVIYKPNSGKSDDYGNWRVRGSSIVGYQHLNIKKALKNTLSEERVIIYFSPGEHSFDRSQTLFWMLLHNGFADPKVCKSKAPYVS